MRQSKLFWQTFYVKSNLLQTIVCEIRDSPWYSWEKYWKSECILHFGSLLGYVQSPTDHCLWVQRYFLIFLRKILKKWMHSEYFLDRLLMLCPISFRPLSVSAADQRFFLIFVEIVRNNELCTLWQTYLMSKSPTDNCLWVQQTWDSSWYSFKKWEKKQTHSVLFLERLFMLCPISYRPLSVGAADLKFFLIFL